MRGRMNFLGQVLSPPAILLYERRSEFCDNFDILLYHGKRYHQVFRPRRRIEKCTKSIVGPCGRKGKLAKLVLQFYPVPEDLFGFLRLVSSFPLFQLSAQDQQLLASRCLFFLLAFLLTCSICTKHFRRFDLKIYITFLLIRARMSSSSSLFAA